ncbi:rhomboid family intramembrane serine protease [archaeon]|nr:MAG: rhomboid family intramembrane serine protease [archaeon]
MVLRVALDAEMNSLVRLYLLLHALLAYDFLCLALFIHPVHNYYMKLTVLLIIINVLAFIYTSASSDYYVSRYGFNTRSFLSGHFEVLFTSMFLHAGLAHIFGNMVALFFLGWTVEKNSKWWQYLLAYFGAGIAGGLSMFLLPAGVIAIGASAAISGIVGMGVFKCPTKFVLFPEIIPLPFVPAGAVYLIANVTGLLAPSEVGYAAHLAGFAVGSAMGLKWGKHGLRMLLGFVATIMVVVIAMRYLHLL